jgi:hypothetical protein
MAIGGGMHIGSIGEHGLHGAPQALSMQGS